MCKSSLSEIGTVLSQKLRHIFFTNLQLELVLFVDVDEHGFFKNDV